MFALISAGRKVLSGFSRVSPIDVDRMEEIKLMQWRLCWLLICFCFIKRLVGIILLFSSWCLWCCESDWVILCPVYRAINYFYRHWQLVWCQDEALSLTWLIIDEQLYWFSIRTFPVLFGVSWFSFVLWYLSWVIEHSMYSLPFSCNF